MNKKLKTNPEVDAYFRGLKKWRAELLTLRMIALECGLVEELKWRHPCYCIDGGNVAILGGLKDCSTFNFFKGVLLKDPEGILQKPGENSRSSRMIRFTSEEQIIDMKPTLLAYIGEAIDIEKAGVRVDLKEDSLLGIPIELQSKFEAVPAFETAFFALTPGRQRAYVLHFSAAKQASTRVSRIEKALPLILVGKGLNDCTCGLSKRMPACDGSHKFAVKVDT